MTGTIEKLDVSPNTWYRRQVRGGDFSLEANTPTVPEPGRFYVLQQGRAVFTSRRFAEALEVYRSLCEKFWEGRLDAKSGRDRLRAAWGLLSQNLYHKGAVAVVQEDGDSTAQSLLQSMRRKAAAMKRAAARRRPAKAA